MIEPTGYTALDLIGFTDRGAYDPTANYVKNDIVTVGNTKWRCKVDDTTGVTPAENANWTIYLESATSLAGMSDVTLTSPKNGDGLVHDGNEWTNVPIVTQEMQDILGAKNLLPNTASTMVDSGVTFTVNSDGTIQTSDTASATTFIDLPVPRSLGGRVVKLSGCPIGGAYGKYRCICMADGTDIANDIGNGSTFTIPNNFTSCVVRCLVYTGYGNGLTFKPMITLASQPNSDYAHYVPYAKTNRELTESGVQTIYEVPTPAQQAANYSFPLSKSIKNAKKLIISYNYGATGYGYSRVVDVPTYFPTILDTIVENAFSSVEVSTSSDYVKVVANGSVNGVFFRKIDAIY